VPKTRAWEDASDDPDYSEMVTWPDTEQAYTAKMALPTRRAEVSSETANLLKEKCSKQLDSNDCLSITCYSTFE